MTKIAGVPLFAGFMYAAVGSYLCQAWRRFDLRVSGYRPVLTTVLALAIYANFFTHHWIVDLRVLIANGLLLALRRTWVFYRVGVRRYRMLLAVSPRGRPRRNRLTGKGLRSPRNTMLPTKSGIEASPNRSS